MTQENHNFDFSAALKAIQDGKPLLGMFRLSWKWTVELFALRGYRKPYYHPLGWLDRKHKVAFSFSDPWPFPVFCLVL